MDAIICSEMNGSWSVLENVPNIDWKQISNKAVDFFLSENVDIFFSNYLNRSVDSPNKVVLILILKLYKLLI
jgi:hypothetical protein